MNIGTPRRTNFGDLVKWKVGSRSPHCPRLATRREAAQRGVHVVDLPAYIDKRREAALKECRQLAGTTYETA